MDGEEDIPKLFLHPDAITFFLVDFTQSGVCPVLNDDGLTTQ